MKDNKKSALILGASGLVGSEVLSLSLESDLYNKIVIVVRSPLTIKHNKLVEKIIDFDMPKWEEIFPVDHVYCCLGTTIKKAGAKTNFIKVDPDYPLAFAAAAKKWESSIFSLITAAGVSPESKIFYNNVKGQLEKKLKSLELFSTLIFRPSLLLGERKEFRLGEKIGSGIAKVTSWMTPKTYRAIHCKAVAKAMLAESFADKTGFNIISNKSMHRFS
ncbi:MAG: oxidoreductase [Candidatus Neomarinimicrobiota bacterium]|nr:MAG: oxidoreductase [Candidatus Neomarinimicrobiota bacterium]